LKHGPRKKSEYLFLQGESPKLKTDLRTSLSKGKRGEEVRIEVGQLLFRPTMQANSQCEKRNVLRSFDKEHNFVLSCTFREPLMSRKVEYGAVV